MVTEPIQMAQVALTESEIEAAVRVLRSGSLRQGKVTQRFEEAFAEAVGARYAVAVSSGSAALHVAYLAALQPESDVLVPAFSHISTGSMAHFAGCRPILCDVDRETFTLDLEDAERKRTDKTNAIAPVHLYGNSCNIDAITEYAARHNLTLVWDAAQAHATRYRGKDVGGYDDVVCYSFYPTKNMITGEGGMITTNREEIAERCRLLRAHGQTEKYYHPSFGLNYRMTDVEAAIGLEQLDRLGEMVSRRRANAARLDAGLSAVPGVVTPHVDENVEHSYHQYTIRVALDSVPNARDQLIAHLKDRGINTGVHYPRPINLQPAFVAAYGPMPCPTCEALAGEVLSLPVHPGLNSDDVERIILGVCEAMGNLEQAK